jgi:DNA-binding CsgD family transcriptional regulator
VASVPRGTHLCLFYETKDDLIAAVVPFIAAGLANNEYCAWAVSEPLTIAEAEQALRAAVPEFDRRVAKGDIEILSGREVYLKDDVFDMQRLMNLWMEKLSAALARGYSGMRVSGNAFWFESEHCDNFNAYEREIDAVLVGQPITAFCTYPLTTSRAAAFLEVAHAHRFAVVRSKGDWRIVETVEAAAERPALTQREREVLEWVAGGKSARDIGEILGIAKRTVDEHANSAARKLGAANRTQAVALALLHRLIEPR